MFFSGFFGDYDKSIKNIEVEEKYDLVFSRPLGFIFAKLLHKIGFSPTGISFLGLIIGVSGGILLFWQNSLIHTISGGILITLAGILDSSDGQAARLYNQRSQMGRYLDGVIDNLVFISCYVGGILYFSDVYTFIGCLIIIALAGASHSIKSSIYEYYKAEFLFFFKDDDSQRYSPPEEVDKQFDRSTWTSKIAHYIVSDYMKKQQFFKTRKEETIAKFEQAKDAMGEDFKKLYLKENKPMLNWWAWISGSNVMRNLIIISAVFGHFDYFAFLNIASFLLFIAVGKLQTKSDKRILSQIADTLEN